MAFCGLLFLTSSSSGDQGPGGAYFETWGTAAAVLFTWGIVRSEVLFANEGASYQGFIKDFEVLRNCSRNVLGLRFTVYGLWFRVERARFSG